MEPTSLHAACRKNVTNLVKPYLKLRACKRKIVRAIKLKARKSTLQTPTFEESPESLALPTPVPTHQSRTAPPAHIELHAKTNNLEAVERASRDRKNCHESTPRTMIVDDTTRHSRIFAHLRGGSTEVVFTNQQDCVPRYLFTCLRNGPHRKALHLNHTSSWSLASPRPPHTEQDQKKRHEKHDKYRTKKTKGFAINSLSTKPCYLTRARPEQKKKHNSQKKCPKTKRKKRPNTQNQILDGRKERDAKLVPATPALASASELIARGRGCGRRRACVFVSVPEEAPALIHKTFSKNNGSHGRCVFSMRARKNARGGSPFTHTQQHMVSDERWL